MEKHRNEARRIVRFVIIGGLSFGFFALLYALLSRWLWTSGNRTLENVIANVMASTFNFWAHRTWTFQAAQSGHGIKHAGRYLFVLVTAFALQALFFWFGHEVLHLYDFAVAVGVGLIIPFYTYLMHRLFTFREYGTSVL